MSEEARPPYVMFEVREMEDREASMKAGHYVAKDVNVAIVTPSGTKDRIEKNAEEWLAGLREMAQQERVPQNWVGMYQKAYDHWKETRETPEFGTPITSWPSLSPAQVKNLLDANIRTVEELSEATEEAIMRLGMGGRALKEKAKAWLDSSSSTGKVSEELAALRIENSGLAEQNKDLAEQNKKLTEQLKAIEDRLAKVETDASKMK